MRNYTLRSFHRAREISTNLTIKLNPISKISTDFSYLLYRITITTRGKHLALDTNVLPRLLKLLKEPCVELRLNALKVITVLSEAPKARAQLLNSLSEIVTLKADHDSQAIRKAAQIAERTITWKP